jgi:CRISPR-associated endonuclease/helicase Cas3
MRSLLAKPPTKYRLITLRDHTNTVRKAADTLVDRFGTDILRFWKLEGMDLDRFRTLVQVAAWLHDLGKANNQFQAYICAESPDPFAHPQAVRHETISLLISCQPFFDDHLKQHLTVREILAIRSAVASHHSKKFDPEKRDQWMEKTACSGRIRVELNHPDFHELWNTSPFGIPDRIEPCDLVVSVMKGEWEEVNNVNVYPTSRRFRKGNDPMLTGAIKSTLITADVIGSIINEHQSKKKPSEDQEDFLIPDLINWSQEVFSQKHLDDHIKSEQDAIPNYKVRPFQAECEQSTTPLTLLLQGCGSGKTHAAMLWASRRGVGKRIFFCFPTRDTAKAAYEKSQKDPITKGMAQIIHGLADLDRFKEEDQDQDPKDHNNRAEYAEAYALWQHPLVFCTVDTVLGLLSQYRRSVALSPCLAQSVFVFDEIHSYDAMLFNGLVRFLKAFEADSLMMTASLPQSRLERLQRAFQDKMTIVRDLQRQEEKEVRYHRVVSDDSLKYAIDAYHQGKRVLVIINTVDRAIAWANDIEEELKKVKPDASVICYHSRYPYRRREEIRESVLKQFGQDKDQSPAIIVTTQVAQVSLDISCDVMLSEEAPACDLIQRLGRLNRWLTQDGEYLILPVPSSGPYSDTEIELGREWLGKLMKDTSQLDLEEALKELPKEDENEDTRDHTLLDEFSSKIGSAREEHFTISVVLKEDLAWARKQQKPGEHLDLRPYEIKMLPPKEEYWFWKKVNLRYIPDSHKIIYSETRGARWQS